MLKETLLLQRRHLPGLSALLKASGRTSLSCLNRQASYPAAAVTAGVQQNELQAVSISGSASPPHAVPEPAVPSSLAQAIKNRWKQGRPRTHRVPGWLNWTTLGAGAAIVAAGLDKTPITGRWQYVVSSYSADPGFQESLQHRAEHWPTQSSSQDSLQEQGLQLMQALYQTAAAGVNRIAITNSSLRWRLHQIPEQTVLRHSADHLLPETSHVSVDSFLCLTASAGDILQHQTPEEMIWVVSRELAHAIGQHQAEELGWGFLISKLLLARTVLAVILRACSLRGLLLDGLLLGGVFIPAFFCWLDHQMDHDADAMGAVISKAAGCSSAAIISGMQRRQVHAMLKRKAQFPERAKAFDSQTKAHMAALQQLLPGTHLPDFLLSSKELLQVVRQATPNHSPEVQQRVSAIMARLEQLQGERRFLLRGPFIERKLSGPPEWSERIRGVRQLLAQLPSEPDFHAHVQMPDCLKDASAAMKLYQSNDKWSQLQGKEWEEGQRAEQVRKVPVALLDSVTAVEEV